LKRRRAASGALRRLQRTLERYYGLERAPDVVRFVAQGDGETREHLLVRETDDALEIKLVLPPIAPEFGLNDGFLQLLEGVSHFLYLVERVRTGLPATQLELELQAEVDKFVLLALSPSSVSPALERRALHEQLYEHVTYLHDADTELGERYRLANDLAARFTSRLLDAESGEARGLLRRFYRAGQGDKIRLARAA
jgi:hypothetical protein